MPTSDRFSRAGLADDACKIYRSVGFKSGRGFLLWITFSGILTGFAISRLQFLNFWGVFCDENRPRGSGAMPGECFYFTMPGRYHVGIILHLATVLLASILACVQFVPAIRRKAIMVHRINGYAVVSLAVLSTVAALVITRRSAGGGIDVQSGVYALAIAFVFSLTMAIISIRRLQIEKHRTWMIRAWSYAGVPVTMRIILLTGAVVVSYLDDYYLAQPCDKIRFVMRSEHAAMAAYPQCAPFFSGENPAQQAVVRANWIHAKNPMEATAAFNIVFGSAVWLALILHLIGAEFYLHLTSAGHEALLKTSYVRQVQCDSRNSADNDLDADDRDGRWSAESRSRGLTN
ncbi:hypothetical protein GGS21DRAFT_485646 [Xylaria nigripes]|nr:hypothetical protein GGS21DRAFT_485646 [Xylaria nigripes]